MRCPRRQKQASVLFCQGGGIRGLFWQESPESEGFEGAGPASAPGTALLEEAKGVRGPGPDPRL